MENIVGILIGVMVCVIILYNVVLPTVNTALNGAGAASANLSASNYTLSGVIPTLLIVSVVVFVVRGMLG
jgi:type II secretory pathway component PulF